MVRRRTVRATPGLCRSSSSMATAIPPSTLPTRTVWWKADCDRAESNRWVANRSGSNSKCLAGTHTPAPPSATRRGRRSSSNGPFTVADTPGQGAARSGRTRIRWDQMPRRSWCASSGSRCMPASANNVRAVAQATGRELRIDLPVPRSEPAFHPGNTRTLDPSARTPGASLE
jgi:hypothetical protein